MTSRNSFGTQTTLNIGEQSFQIYSLPALEKAGFTGVSRLPYSMKILLENLVRREDDAFVKADDIRAVAGWNAKAGGEKEISFMPARVLLQDFTGVPCVVDLAAMRDAMVALKGNPDRVNPLQPVELVIDHSVQVDYFGRADAFTLNAELEFSRNRERYAFLRWGQRAFNNFKVVPPDTGIVHQVNIEYLARVVFTDTQNGVTTAYPDTLVGTDSHTTMVNGLGVVGWGVGGIEAEAAMLGQPISMLIPQVLGVRLTGAMPQGATATDLVLTITEMLRKQGVVGKFVEFFGDGLGALTIADRATLGNMCPEYGATVAIFPVDDMTLDYLRLTGRDDVADKAGRALRQGAGALSPRRCARRGLLGDRGARPGDHRTEPGRTEAAAGSRRAAQGQGGLPDGAAGDAGAGQAGEGLGRRRWGASGRGRRDRRRGAVRRGRRRPGARFARSWRGRHRGDHQLHQHVESERDDWRRAGGQEGGGARADAQAVGEEQSGARLEGGDGIPRCGGPDPVSRSARIQSRRLRLHDLHRQQRPAAGRSVVGHQGQEPRRVPRC